MLYSFKLKPNLLPYRIPLNFLTLIKNRKPNTFRHQFALHQMPFCWESLSKLLFSNTLQTDGQTFKVLMEIPVQAIWVNMIKKLQA